MPSSRFARFGFRLRGTLALLILGIMFSCCGSSSAGGENLPAERTAPATPSLPVMEIKQDSTITYKDYTAFLEGRINVEIRAQVDGYLAKIFVDEGSYVHAGDPLFKIEDHIYQEQLNAATAGLHAAEATMQTAQIEIDKLTPLVEHNVISEIQLKTAKSNYEVAKASVEQSKDAVSSARINLNFTMIKAPVNGYIGRIPKRIGNLVTKSDAQGLTNLTDIDQVYAYFSMSEPEFLQLNLQNPGKTVEEKIKGLPPVSLVLANENVYDHLGRVDLVNGQFERTSGAIALRATFPNPEKMLRSGNTGKVRMQQRWSDIFLIPMAATLDQQDKTFIYILGDSNKVRRQNINIEGKAGTYYIIRAGIDPGAKIVTEGLGNLTDGQTIVPQHSQ
jgi:membrane fusion protein, multidrug efflux system